MEHMSKEDMIKEAVEEAKAKAAQEEHVASSDKPEEEIEEDVKRILEDLMEFEEVEAQEDNDEISSLEKVDGVEDANTEDEVIDLEDAKEIDETDGIKDTEESDTGKEKKLFGRKQKKDKKDEKIEELTDRLARSMAEFDNFRKRTEKEKSRMYEVGAKDIIEKILPTIDNFERGLSVIGEEDKSHPFMEGMEKIYKHLMTTLEDIHVKPIEAVGSQFNPDLHNAVMHVEDENYGENTVVEEFQKGYTYRDNVIRYSMVKVAN